MLIVFPQIAHNEELNLQRIVDEFIPNGEVSDVVVVPNILQMMLLPPNDPQMVLLPPNNPLMVLLSNSMGCCSCRIARRSCCR